MKPTQQEDYLPFSSDTLNIRTATDILLGFAIGDAMGVPVEFQSREELVQNPVTSFRGFGSHPVPPGTWSDDTSMTLATLDSLSFGLNYDNIMQKFCQWKEQAVYTATDIVFDIGITTQHALTQYQHGKAPLDCGCCHENDNGNGSLMRIIPAVFYICSHQKHTSLQEKMTIIHNISSLTHGHPRSKMACGIYAFLLDGLMDTRSKDAVQLALQSAKEYYQNDCAFTSEYGCFERLFSESFQDIPEQEIRSSGYVVDTLEAAVWCFLNTNTYRECILKAVNLGNDTDTIAAIAGGLAGCFYGQGGLRGIPVAWIRDLIRGKQILNLCHQFFQHRHDTLHS